MAKIKVLILGGTQFVGRNLVETLHAHSKYEITLLNRGNNQLNLIGVENIIANRKNKLEITSALKDKYFDIIYDISGYTKEDSEFVIDALQKKPQKYVYISTAAVYLPQIKFPIKEDATTGKHPVWGEYGISKLEAENYLRSQQDEFELPLVIVRPSYLYGKYNHIPRETFVFEHLVKGKPILLPNGGNAITQFGHIFDLTEVLIGLIENDKAIGETFNISTNNYHSLRGFVDIAAKVANIEAKIIEVEMDKYQGLKDREIFPFDNQSYFTDISKAKELLGYQPKYDLENGLRAEWKRFKNNKEYLLPREKEVLSKIV